MKKMNYDTMIRSTLTLVLVTVMLLSGVLGVRAQAAVNKLKLELPTEYFGQPTDTKYVKEIDNTLYAFVVTGDPIEQMVAYMTALEKEYGLEPQVKMEDETLTCYVKENGNVHILMMWEAGGKKILVGYNNKTVTISTKAQENTPKKDNTTTVTKKDNTTTATEHEIHNVSSTYITNGGEYTVAVGDAITLYNPRTPTSTYYAYTWSVKEGEDHVMLDRAQGTCQVVGLTEGKVVLECGLDYSVNYYPGKYDHYSYTYTITINVIGAEHAGEFDYGTMTGKLCPRCHGDKKVEMSGSKITCDVCDGSGLWP